VSLGPLFQFIYWIVAVVDANLKCSLGLPPQVDQLKYDANIQAWPDAIPRKAPDRFAHEERLEAYLRSCAYF
jgi:hypothetical protein